MGIVAIDIETASPWGEPDDFQNTDKFEAVCIGLAHWETIDSDPDVEVLFRTGGWDSEATAAFLSEIVAWADGRPIETTLTFNGAKFDAHHLLNWADDCVDSGHLNDEAQGALTALFAPDTHMDLMQSIKARHGHRLSFEDACAEYGIETAPTRYDEYDLPESLPVKQPIVENWHIGARLGEQYVEWTISDEETPHLAELERLLVEYTRADIEPLAELSVALDAVDRHPKL